jgi:hypothetical protein
MMRCGVRQTAKAPFSSVMGCQQCFSCPLKAESRKIKADG